MATKTVTDKQFEQALKTLSDGFGQGYNTRGLAEPNPKAIPTGHDDLDSLLTKGAHGIYLGGIIEICGSESSGKSSIALRTVGNAQKLGHRCCWIDAECSFTEDLAILNGADPEKIVLPDLSDTKASENSESLGFFNAGQILEMIYKSVCSDVYGLIILDSVAGLMPQRILDEDFDPNSAGYAELARHMSTLLPKIVQACKKTQTSVIFINQLRDQPGAYFQDRFHTPGGRALKFFAHQRISIEKVKGKDGEVWSSEDGKEERIGHYARATIVKNRKAPPAQEGAVEVPIYYKKYFPDNAKKCYDLARALQVITIRNNILTWKNEDDSVVLQKNGESIVLAEIRANKLESKLAAACVAAANSEKNKSKKIPITIPTTIQELAKDKSVKDETKAKKKSSVAALEL